MGGTHPSTVEWGWFGDTWTAIEYVWVLVQVMLLWVTLLMLMQFTVVITTITMPISVTLIWLIVDPIMGMRAGFEERWLQTIMISFIIYLAALIFQTGRLNLKLISAMLGA